MAQRRMFSPDIVCSEEFCDMPPSTRELYFQLGMRADDDGFVQPKGVIRSLGAKEDDLKVLIAKRFVLPFETGVVVIKHWLIHNMIRADRYKETRFLEEKNSLFLKENKAYTDNPDNGKALATNWQPNGNQPAPQVRLGKVSLGKDKQSTAKPRMEKSFSPLGAEILKAFEDIDPKNKTYYGNTSQRAACDFLVNEYGLEEVKKRISILTRTNKLPYFPSITTPVQLRDKWVQLQDAADKKKSEVFTKGRGLA